METIQILSLKDAIVFEPKEKTLLIRILGPGHVENTFHGDFPLLAHEKKFMKILHYEFDDVTLDNQDLWFPHNEIFEEYHATKIINSFDKAKDLTNHLVVHCYAGLQRSPAVAAALNHIFDLKVLEESFLYPEKHAPNMHVYNTMIQTSKDMGFVFPFSKSGKDYFL